jgi:hypothetical protein
MPKRVIVKKIKKKKMKQWEKFAEEQLEKYIEIHKKHEKDLNYIG